MTTVRVDAGKEQIEDFQWTGPYVDGSVQDCSNSIASAVNLSLYSTLLLYWSLYYYAAHADVIFSLTTAIQGADNYSWGLWCRHCYFIFVCYCSRLVQSNSIHGHGTAMYLWVNNYSTFTTTWTCGKIINIENTRKILSSIMDCEFKKNHISNGHLTTTYFPIRHQERFVSQFRALTVHCPVSPERALNEPSACQNDIRKIFDG